MAGFYKLPIVCELVIEECSLVHVENQIARGDSPPPHLDKEKLVINPIRREILIVISEPSLQRSRAACAVAYIQCRGSRPTFGVVRAHTNEPSIPLRRKTLFPEVATLAEASNRVRLILF
jgi:hypothetical protein